MRGRPSLASLPRLVIAALLGLLATFPVACGRSGPHVHTAPRATVPTPEPEPPCCPEPVALEAAQRLAERHRVAALSSARFTHAALWTALGPALASSSLRVAQVGRSAQGRSIRTVTFGAGPTTVLLWSQMHGDEPTATMALADLIAWFADPADSEPALRRFLAERLTIVMVPMLNPDGAERQRRENAQGIDVNRDARRLATPEARVLDSLHRALRPAFALNLHDQSPRVLTMPGGRQVAIALLAPPADEARAFGTTRSTARLLAVRIAEVLERVVPGQVAQYDDTYNPRAFGDLMQQRGTSTVLIESGGLRDDPARQRLRTLNVVAIITALDAIADARFQDANTHRYAALPRNGAAAVDVLIRGGRLVVPGTEPARVDVALVYDDPVSRRGPRVRAAGRLTNVLALDTIDASGLFLHPAATMLSTQGGGVGLRVNAPAALTIRRGPAKTSVLVRAIGEATASRGG